jgi:hypothetical protein
MLKSLRQLPQSVKHVGHGCLCALQASKKRTQAEAIGIDLDGYPDEVLDEGGVASRTLCLVFNCTFRAYSLPHNRAAG